MVILDSTMFLLPSSSQYQSPKLPSLSLVSNISLAVVLGLSSVSVPSQSLPTPVGAVFENRAAQFGSLTSRVFWRLAGTEDRKSLCLFTPTAPVRGRAY